MEKINFKDLPSTETPIDSTNLNLIQTYVETEINSVKTNLESQINSIASKLFPVGSIYTSVNNTNPSSFLGGTWERFAKGKTLVGVNEDDIDFNNVLKTAGEKVHTLTINEMPQHNHEITHDPSNASVISEIEGSQLNQNVYYGGSEYHAWKLISTIGSAGGGQAHNNLQPYITVYFWRRTA